MRKKELKKKQILIVEDEAIIAMNIRNLLENLGYNICGLASSAEEAVKLAEEKHPDLILIDIILDGEIDGIDTVVEIKKTQNKPIIYMTAHSDEKTLSRAKATEPHGFIVKPINYNELRLTIEIVFHKREMEEKLKTALEELETMNKKLISTQNELINSKKKYQNIFNMMIDGYALYEIILDQKGKPADFRFLEINPAFEKLTGLTGDIIGKTIKEVLSDIEDYWIETLGKVALSGESIRFENYAAPLKKWLEMSAYCPKEKQVASLIVDITYRKNRGNDNSPLLSK